MFFGIDGDKLLLIAIVAVLLVGPERLPHYAESLGRFTVRAREWLGGAKTRVKEEMGEDFDDIEWRKLDPRQYDPRRIIRDALLDDGPTASVPITSAPVMVEAPGASPSPARTIDRSLPVPFDSEAT